MLVRSVSYCFIIIVWQSPSFSQQNLVFSLFSGYGFDDFFVGGGLTKNISLWGWGVYANIINPNNINTY